MIIGVLPILIPFTAALFLMFGRQNTRYQISISTIAICASVGAGIQLLSTVQNSGTVVVHMGNWVAPFGIVFAADMLSAIMVMLASLVSLTCIIFSFSEIDIERQRGGFFPLYQLLIFGVNGSFLTGDFFNLFVFFEVVLMTSYVLLTLGNEHRQATSGLTYLSLNLIGSTLFLAGAGLLYGQVGTLNMAHIAARIADVPNKGLLTVAAVIFLFVFGLKCAMFPVNNWLPASYTSPPTAISALFAGLLTKVGVYAMFRAFGTIFVHDVGFTHTQILLPLAGLTMLLGVWGAMVQYNIPGILAFHSISQVGYILMGLALFSPLALAGAVFHMIHHSLIKSSLFLIGGGVGSVVGSQDLKKINGLLTILPSLAIFFMISAMALAGTPPLSGFYSKLALITSALAQNHPILVAAALATSLFTLYSMIKIWRLGFWGELKIPNENKTPRYLVSKGLMLSCAISVFFVVTLSLFAGPIMAICQKAGNDLLDRNAYISAVLNSQPNPHPQRADGGDHP